MAEGLHVKHRKWEPEGVHGQLEGCNRNLRPKAAVAKMYTHGNKSRSFRNSEKFTPIELKYPTG